MKLHHNQTLVVILKVAKFPKVSLSCIHEKVDFLRNKLINQSMIPLLTQCLLQLSRNLTVPSCRIQTIEHTQYQGIIEDIIIIHHKCGSSSMIRLYYLFERPTDELHQLGTYSQNIFTLESFGLEVDKSVSFWTFYISVISNLRDIIISSSNCCCSVRLI